MGFLLGLFLALMVAASFSCLVFRDKKRYSGQREIAPKKT
jgi:hypothetical protein